MTRSPLSVASGIASAVLCLACVSGVRADPQEQADPPPIPTEGRLRAEFRAEFAQFGLPSKLPPATSPLVPGVVLNRSALSSLADFKGGLNTTLVSTGTSGQFVKLTGGYFSSVYGTSALLAAVEYKFVHKTAAESGLVVRLAVGQRSVLDVWRDFLDGRADANANYRQVSQVFQRTIGEAAIFYGVSEPGRQDGEAVFGLDFVRKNIWVTVRQARSRPTRPAGSVDLTPVILNLAAEIDNLITGATSYKDLASSALLPRIDTFTITDLVEVGAVASNGARFKIELTASDPSALPLETHVSQQGDDERDGADGVVYQDLQTADWMYGPGVKPGPRKLICRVVNQRGLVATAMFNTKVRPAPKRSKPPASGSGR